MDSLNTGNQCNVNSHSEYNEEPVKYCAHCLSLAIMETDGTLYCDKCGSTDIKEANIFDWEKIYAAKYAGSYLNLGK